LHRIRLREMYGCLQKRLPVLPSPPGMKQRASSPRRYAGAAAGTGDGTVATGVGTAVTGAGIAAIGTTGTGAAVTGKAALPVTGLPQFFVSAKPPRRGKFERKGRSP
jgi:hypothetical protein